MGHQGQTGIYFDSGGHKLLGTLFMAAGDDPKPTAVLLHGIPGIEKNYDLALALRSHGWNCLIFHYRGCWGSAGSYNIHSIPADVSAAMDALAQHPVVDLDRLVLIGHSLGAWAAILAAARDVRPKAAAVISGVSQVETIPLESPAYASFYTPWLTGIEPRELASQWETLTADLNPLKQAARLPPRPLLVIHGEKDEVLPVTNAEALYTAAQEPKELILHPDANHSFTWHRSWLIERVLEWLDRLAL